MSDKKRLDYDYSLSPAPKGYRPKKGYQPKKSNSPKPDGRDVSGDYQPPSSEGDNPGNKPPPKKP